MRHADKAHVFFVSTPVAVHFESIQQMKIATMTKGETTQHPIALNIAINAAVVNTVMK